MTSLTLDEIKEIHSILKQFRNYECCYENMMVEETEIAIKVLKREINFRELDPVKDKGK